MHSDAYLDHFRHPRGQGSLEAATHQGQVTDPACGDELALDLLVEAGTVQAARFRVRGCSGAIAVGSALTTLLPGRRAEPTCVTRADLEAVLGPLPASKRHALRLALNVLAAALGQAQSSLT